MNFVNSNLCIITDTLFWKGKEVVGVTNISYRKTDNIGRYSIIVRGADAVIIKELQEVGVFVRNSYE